MTVMHRFSAGSFANISMACSLVSGLLSLFFLVGTSKPFVILTSATPIGAIAGLIAVAVIAYESFKHRTVSTRSWVALVLAFAVYAFGDFVIIDYASGV